MLQRYAWMSVAAALATIGLKTWAWQVTGSVGMLSDALESLINLAAALLALSMLPVVGGAWLGMQLNFVALFRAAPIMTPLLMFGAMLASLFVVTRLRDSAWGVAALIAPVLALAAYFINYYISRRRI